MTFFNTPLMGDLLATSLATAKIENGGFVNVTNEGGNCAGKAPRGRAMQSSSPIHRGAVSPRGAAGETAGASPTATTSPRGLGTFFGFSRCGCRAVIVRARGPFRPLRAG